MYKRIQNLVARVSGLGLHNPGLRAVRAWADQRGLACEALSQRGNFALTGQLEGRPWRMEYTPAGRDFIAGSELRARAELGLPPDAAVMLINRSLKERLEKRAYEHVTQGVQTTVDSELPEEARWLALYDEMGWSHAPTAFWDRYALVAGSRVQAQHWLDDGLVRLLMAWPGAATPQTVPFILQVQRGRVYLRMEYQRHTLPMLEHAVEVFTRACVTARTLPAQ